MRTGQGGHRADDRRIPAEHGRGVGVTQAEGLGNDRHGQRPGQAEPQVRGTVRPHGRHQAVGFGHHERGQPCVDLGAAKALGERSTVAAVRGAVQGQHARPDDAGRGEPRVVHREGHAVPHDRDREVVSGDQPAVQGRQPGDRLGVPQASQPGVRVVVEIRQGDGRAQGERARAGSGTGPPILVTEGHFDHVI